MQHIYFLQITNLQAKEYAQASRWMPHQGKRHPVCAPKESDILGGVTFASFIATFLATSFSFFHFQAAIHILTYPLVASHQP